MGGIHVPGTLLEGQRTRYQGGHTVGNFRVVGGRAVDQNRVKSAGTSGSIRPYTCLM